MEDFKEQYARFFCHSRFGSLRRLIKRTQRNRVSHRFGHTSILQDGARTFSINAVLGLLSGHGTGAKTASGELRAGLHSQSSQAGVPVLLVLRFGGLLL